MVQYDYSIGKCNYKLYLSTFAKLRAAVEGFIKKENKHEGVIYFKPPD